jgi:hypothetical protein
MVKVIAFLRRPVSCSLEDFQTHWLEYHAQLLCRIRAMRRYVQYHTLADDPALGAMPQAALSQEEPFDGAAAAWYDSVGALQTQRQNDPDTATAIEDMAFFTDLSRTVSTLTEERVIIEPRGAPPYVLIGGLRRAPNLNRVQFEEAWLKHAEIGSRAYDQGHVVGYLQNRTLPQADEKVEDVGAVLAPFDGVVMLYFESIMRFKALMASPLARDVFEDEKSFVDHSRSVYTMTKRHAITELIR